MITGEATPDYLFHLHAARRLEALVPQARLIAMLRHPTSRAFSHHFHNWAKGREPLPFAEAIAQEDQRLAGELERLQADETYYSAALQHFSYRWRGIYVDHLKRYSYFLERKQLLVLKSEDFFRDPQAVYDRVLEFLGLPPAKIRDATPYNIGGYKNTRTPTHDELDAFYRPHNQRLYELLGVDFGW
jgi:hypothetical protein